MEQTAVSPRRRAAQVSFDPPRHVRRRRWIRRHRVLSVLLVFVVLLTPVWWSLGSALTNPGLGTSVPARFSEWLRGHGAGSIVTWAENTWYSHHAPPVGGKPAKGAIPSTGSTAPRVPTTPRVSIPAHLAAPTPISPIATTPVAGEGVWHPAGRLVHGLPAVYEAYLRPDNVHTSVVTGVAWMDTKLLSATLYSGSTIPGGGPWRYGAPITATAAGTLVAAFNSGFLMSNAQGGYYSEGKTVFPLRTGQASLVIYDDGTATVGQWGRDATMTQNVSAVRQNLALLVDNGQPVSGLNASDTTRWGFTLKNQIYVWRSGVGVTASGALVYAGGPSLNITELADVLARAGAVRAMELDINTDWVNMATYSPSVPTGLADVANGSCLLSTMSGGPGRYFEPYWSRDFITMSGRTS
jgi:hypothetical protein